MASKTTKTFPLWPVVAGVLGLLSLFLLLRGPRVETREVEKIVEKEVEVSVEKEVIREVEKIVEVQAPRLAISSGVELQTTSKGFAFGSKVVLENGELAIDERRKNDTYRSEHILTVKVPRAAATLSELEKSSPGLGRAFPGLESMVENAVVSDFFETLYKNKSDRLKKNSAKLGSLLTKHNFFDCQTMLNLRHESGRKVFLLQGDMDVVSDGSDGDRLPVMPDEIVNSTYYQPTTSYGWAKVGRTPNPLISGYEKRLRDARKELTDPAKTADRKSWVRGRINDLLVPGIEEMKRRSFLIAEYDPFIVIPINIIVDRRDSYGPKVGDYAVVIHKGILYPAIVGDAGPSFKVGEASLRMARQIDSRSSSYRRPVNELSVTYLCFPKTAKKPHRPPNYEDIRNECERLLNEIGGVGAGEELFRWENTLPGQEVDEAPLLQP